MHAVLRILYTYSIITDGTKCLELIRPAGRVSLSPSLPISLLASIPASLSLPPPPSPRYIIINRLLQ